MSSSQQSIACFLGAGFSYPAGFPLASALFAGEFPMALSEASWKRMTAIREQYEAWRTDNSDAHAEQFLATLYQRAQGAIYPPWQWAVEYLSAVIATAGTPNPSRNQTPRYTYRINRPVKSAIHTAFWNTILTHTDRLSVVTTNYDMLVEQTLRHRPMYRSSLPGCFYGGFPRPQQIVGSALPFSNRTRERVIEMSGTVPLFKLHGSLNWHLIGNVVSIVQDARAVHRRGGEAAIVPPLPEKLVPVWLKSVWSEAEQALRTADIWIVCGYSMPAYDTQICKLLQNSAEVSGKSIVLISPDSAALKPRWCDLAPQADVVALPGLPDALPMLAEWLEDDQNCA